MARLDSVPFAVAPPIDTPRPARRRGLAAAAGLAVTAGVAVAVAAACGQRGPLTTSSQGAAADQMCALLTATQAAMSAGEPVQSGQAGQGPYGPACDWYTVAAPRRAAVYLERIYDNLYDAIKVTGSITPVPGLGQEAYLDKDSALYVRAGATRLLVVVTNRAGRSNPAAEERAAAWALPHL